MGKPLLDRDATRRIEEQLSTHLGHPVHASDVTRLSGGACQQNLLIRLTDADGNPVPDPWVLRADASTSLPMSLRRRDEFRVVRAASAAGVLTPDNIALLPDVPRPDRDAVLMPWTPGEAVGARIVSSDALTQARETLPEALATQLATIHSITPSRHPDLLPGADADPLDTSLSQLRTLTGGLSALRPALAAAVRWLEDNLPTDRQPVLVHGDFRVGNFLVTPEGLSAILDWEFAHWGCAAEDIAWIMVRDWRFSRPELPVGGLCGRERFITAWEKASGRTIPRTDITWWEVFGNVRWAAGCHFQTMRVLAGGEQNLELLAISRRAEEMEFEALRLITFAST